MSIWVYAGALIGLTAYALVALAIGLDVHDGNNGIWYSRRSNPWVQAIFWLPIWLLACAWVLWAVLQAGGANKHRR